MVDQNLCETMLANINVIDANVSAIASKTRHSKHTPERVSEVFGIGLDKAKIMLQVTTKKRDSARSTPNLTSIQDEAQPPTPQ